jgi:mannose-6-phosphate isomerase-like protein (cupin superfamily)
MNDQFAFGKEDLMGEIKVIRRAEVKPELFRGQTEEGGQCRKIIVTKRMFLNVDEVNPGFSPHRWHKHTTDEGQGYRTDYAEDFEEIYYIVSGSGVIQWKGEKGEVREEKVSPGDTIYMPPGLGEHQLLNSGTEKIVLMVIGTPPSRTTVTK